MVAALIFVISVAALVQFAVCYFRAVMASVASEPLSQVFESYLSGGPGLGGDTFGITCVLSELCPEIEPGASAASLPRLAPVRVYHGLLKLVQSLSRQLMPSVSSWAGRELATCSRYAAVVIDHRLARNLEAIARIHAC